VVVLDAGYYYSFDWAVVVAGELRHGTSGTSLEAMSVLLERAGVLIAEQHGGRPQPLALEAALRRGREHLLVLGERVPLQPVLARAAAQVGGVALEALRQALRLCRTPDEPPARYPCPHRGSRLLCIPAATGAEGRPRGGRALIINPVKTNNNCRISRCKSCAISMLHVRYHGRLEGWPEL
jgi:hypothetical protein